MNIFVIWLVLVVAWNYGYPQASPFEDVLVAVILALFNKNKDFHVKLFEKSPVKRAFLGEISKKLSKQIQIWQVWMNNYK